MLTDEQIRAALRPLYADAEAFEMAMSIGHDEARAIVRAAAAIGGAR